MYGDHAWSGMGGSFMWIFWILIIVGIVLLIRACANRGNGPTSSESPLEILRKRYANGDISEEEFERRRKVLENDG